MSPFTLATAVVRRARRLVARRRFEHDLDDEMRFHFEMALARRIADGVNPAAAREQTLKEFGSMDRFKDEVRDARGITVSDDLRRDLRFAFRTLARTPGFTAIALLTFALGIGANTAIFSVVNAVLLRPLPYPNAARIVGAFETLKGQSEPGSVSYWNWKDWQTMTTSFDALGAYATSGMVLDGDGEPERVRVARLSANVLPMLGTLPAAGRVFANGEDVKGKDHVVVLSDALWHRRFGGERNVVGRTMSIEGAPYTIVGIMPPSFTFPMTGAPIDMWTPFVPPDQALDPRARGWHWMGIVGLLKPGVTVARADLDLKQVAERIRLANPLPQANRSATVLPMHDVIVGDIAPMLYTLLGAVLLVFLIACANVANLLLARNATRRKDIAVRVALGASRGQIARQLLTESVVLALSGAVLGLLGARVALGAFAAGGILLPSSGPISPDWRVLTALGAAAILAGLAFGAAPAIQLSPNKIRDGLSDLSVKSTSGSEMRRFRSGLVVAQIALSLMLLIGAGLLMRAFVALQTTPSGINSDHVLTARLAIPKHYTAQNGESTRILRPFLERVRAIPGVRDAGVTSMLPIEESGAQASFWVDRRAWPQNGGEPLVEIRRVSPGYFSALGIGVRAGRNLAESDDSVGTSRVVINETLARLLFPNESPVGRYLLQGSEQEHESFEIVGVVGDVRQSGLAEKPRPEVYSSYTDLRAWFGGGDASVVIKTELPETSVVRELRRALGDVAKDVALTRVRPMSEVIERSLTSRRMTLALFATFAAIALALAASGLYGVIYYLVAQRTREFGIRLALGAGKRRVLTLVLGQSAQLVAAGVALGLTGAALLTRLMSGLLYGVGTRDPVTFVGVPVLLASIAMLAAIIPALRATRVDPVIALRAE